MKLTNKPLYAQAKEAILKIIEENYKADEHFGFMSKLPSEQELCDRLGVSRNTIREALKALENEGILMSRHGVGTFVLRDRKSMQHNLAVLNSTTAIITNQGYTPGTEGIHYGRRILSEPISQGLGVEGSLEVLYIERVRTASGKPMVFVEDYIPYLKGMEESFASYQETGVFAFLRSFGYVTSFSACSINAVLCDERLMKALSLDSPRALLKLQQIHYSEKGTALLYSDSYFLTDELEFNLIRRCSD